MGEPVQDAASLEKRVIRALRQCFDPEIPVNIYDLGLIYKLSVDPSGKVDILMTLTAPNCPVAGSLPAQVESRVNAVEGITGVAVELTFDPPWDRSRMSEGARLSLGLEPEDQAPSIVRFRP